MGVRELYGVNPLEMAVKLIGSTDEKMRVFEAQDRVNLYLEDTKRHVRSLIYRMFTRGRREKFEPFAQLACAQPLFRRIIEEQSRPVYSPPPVRLVYAEAEGAPDRPGEERVPGPGNDQFHAWAKAVRLNSRLKLATRLMHVGNAVALHPRITRLGPVLDVIAPNGFWVLPDPDDPIRELAVIYQTLSTNPSTGKTERVFVYWDDFEAFRFNEKGANVGIPIADPDTKKRIVVNRIVKANGHPGIVPFVVIHRFERWGTYWDTTSGSALVAAQDSLALLQMMLLSLHKSQGHTQLGIKGDIPRDQVLDDENPIHLGEDGEAKVLANPTDPSHHLKTMEAIMLATGASNGVGRDMMNAMQATDLSEATGLLERRADVIDVMREGEGRLFEVLKVVNNGHAEWEIPDKACLSTDYAELSAKVDRLTQLQIRQQEISQGTRNYLDNVIEDNPEITDEDEAEDELEHNLEVNSKWVEKFRALNMAVENNVAQPGQSAAGNGAMGSAVRDGSMTKDQAAAKAQGGAPQGPPSPTPPPSQGR